MRGLQCISLTRSMSKIKGTQKAVKSVAGPIGTNKNGEITIQILAKPGAKSNNITDIGEEGIGVQIASKPVDGEANAELVKYIASVLNLKKNEISLDKGSKSRQKVLLVSNKDCSTEQILSKLKEEMGK